MTNTTDRESHLRSHIINTRQILLPIPSRRTDSENAIPNGAGGEVMQDDMGRDGEDARVVSEWDRGVVGW